MPAKEAFIKIESCLMSETAPSKTLSAYSEQPWFGAYPTSLLLAQKHTKQQPDHHPEGSVWNHTMLVVDEAAKRKQHSICPRAFMWAALLHDIGKPSTTKIRKGRITSYAHDLEGAELALAFLSGLTDETKLAEKTMWLVRFHMQLLFVTRDMPFQDIPGMRAHTYIPEVALLSYCDRLGRIGADSAAERRNLIAFLEKCQERTDLPWLKET